ncbi:MAG: FAD:protein FMN transferase [Eubacterium sp.]|nr:FAD:protein FMN transferase [Eubacterium sp.]
MKRIIGLLLIITLLVTFSACGTKKAENKPLSTTFRCFNTMCTITVYDNISKADFETLRKAIISTCTKYEYSFSKKYYVNFVRKANQNKFANLKSEEKDLIKKSIKYSKMTNGAFDITVCPLVDLWSVGSSNFNIPRRFDIKKLLPKVGYEQLHFDQDTLFLSKTGSIDLGAIAKGYVTDKLVDLLNNSNIESAIIDLGGNVYAYGSKEGKPFKIGIKKPFGNGEYSAIVNVKDKSVITSGIYERYKKVKGKIYSHIIDPKTGYPVDNDLNSVTVISNDCTAGDALSTGFMVMGLKKGMELANKTKDVEAVFIDKDNKLHLTNGLRQNGNNITIK